MKTEIAASFVTFDIHKICIAAFIYCIMFYLILKKIQELSMLICIIWVTICIGCSEKGLIKALIL